MVGRSPEAGSAGSPLCQAPRGRKYARYYGVPELNVRSGQVWEEGRVEPETPL